MTGRVWGEKKAIYGFQPQMNESQRNAKRSEINGILPAGTRQGNI